MSSGGPMIKQKLIKTTLIASAVSVALGSSLAFAETPKINELRIDQPSTDNDEYFELFGNANESLDGLTYLVIGDGAGGSGVIEAVVNLDGQQFDEDGLFLAAESTFSLATADLTTNLNFENSDNVTHLLVKGFTGSNGDDLDTDNDGVLDSMPFTSILDSVALVESTTSGEEVYSNTTVGPNGTFVPAHVYREFDGTGDFIIGDEFTAGLSENETPGALNNTSAPLVNVSINELRIDQPSTDNDEYVELFGEPGASLDGLSFMVIGDGSGGSGTIEALVDLSGNTLDENGFFLIAEATFSLGTADLTTALNFENSDNVTHLVVRNTSLSVGDDVDTDDDGIVDVSGLEDVVDSVALIESVGTGELVYSTTVVGPNGTFVPAHVYRDADGTGEFQIGEFNPADSTNETPGASNVIPVIVDVAINELRIDQPSSDDDEYFELFGAPGASLDGLSFITIGDGPGGSGVIETVVDLSGNVLDENGFFLVAEGAFTLGAADLVTTLNFENGDNVTHMVVRDATASVGDDIDTDDDGTIDVTGFEDVVDSVALIETVGTGDLVYSTNTVGPNGTFVPAHVYRETDGTGTFLIGEFDPSSSTNETPGASNTGNGGGGGGGGTGNLGACDADATLISAVQGSGLSSPLIGQSVVVEGVVTNVAPGLDGVFLQEELIDEDGDPATSEGIFVSLGANATLPALNDVIRVLGTVQESFNRTQINATEVDLSCGTDNTVQAVSLTLPFATEDAPEAYEGMLVDFQQTLTVSSNFGLGSFGEVTVSNGRLYKSTQLFTPGTTEERDLEAANQLNQIIIDDNANGEFVEEVVYPNFAIGGLSAVNTLRLGDTTEQVTGNMDYGFNAYRIRPVTEPIFYPSNPRLATPDIVRGNVTVASFNVLNYFTTLNERGADTSEEFERQADKIVAALVEINADVVGLMEIENNGFGEGSATDDLVGRLNAELGAGTYTFVDNSGQTGTDQIKVALLYKPAVVAPTEAERVLSSANSPTENGQPLFDDGRNRFSLAQKFSVLENSETFVVNVNHLKSKGSGCGAGDDDTTTGQGNCNGTRTRAAKALSQWLAAEYGNEPTLIIGDLNAYAKEDPITELVNGGYTDLARFFEGELAYGYSFRGETGSLDYAMANQTALAKVIDVTDWTINADEPIALDYNVEDQSPLLQAKYYAPDAFRASDHDPVIVSMNFEVAAKPGDVNGDGNIDFADYMMIAGALGTSTGDANFIEAADLDENGAITFDDLRLWYQIFISQ